MDYNSLKAEIIAYTNRNEPAFVAALPSIIEKAMSRIYSEARTLGFQKTIEGSMVDGSALIDKPLDYKMTINLLYVNDGNLIFLLDRSYEFCVNYWPNPTLKSAPVFYSVDLDVPQLNAAKPFIYLSPTPNDVYPYKLTYLSFPPVFNGDNSQNFLTDKYPNLLLYACLVEAIPFLKADERVPLFESLYKRALQDVNNDTKERYTDRVTKRDKD
jgi:hypothetical protein